MRWGDLLSKCRFFFTRSRRHTRFDCDWSSDVCSSDLDKTAPKADSTSKRAALPFVSFFCSTTRVPLRSPQRPLCVQAKRILALSSRQLSAQVDDLDRKSVV